MKNQNMSKIITRNTTCKDLFDYAEVEHFCDVCKPSVDALSNYKQIEKLKKIRTRETNAINIGYHPIHVLVVELY